MTKTDRFPIDELWVDSVHVTSTDYDWSEGWETHWTARACPECPECSNYAEWNADEHEWRCPEPSCTTHDAEEEIEEELTSPMMNYHYELPDLNRFQESYSSPARIEEVIWRIRDLPLCLVEWEDGGYSLALTGGGMDLSWEICEAFTRLGYLPPLHFCDLPAMAGMPGDEDDQYVIDACIRSADVAGHQAQRTHQELLERYRSK